ncbi:MAG: ComF family protein [Syntrophales bacterium]|jgi:ComF family protein|nr:ComF family protein [Syntrophales bacterium]
MSTEGTSHICSSCILSPPPYSHARALGHYDGALLDAIHFFKYRGDMRTGEKLGAYIAAWAYDTQDYTGYDYVIPVPLHRKRLRERGFNQSVILAKQVAKKLSLQLDIGTLVKKIDSRPQVGLGRKHRKRNIKGVFAVVSDKKIDGKRLLLVDDVFTTGSTVGECSRLLIRHGAEEVAVLTLART